MRLRSCFLRWTGCEEGEVVGIHECDVGEPGLPLRLIAHERRWGALQGHHTPTLGVAWGKQEGNSMLTVARLKSCVCMCVCVCYVCIQVCICMRICVC